MIRAERSTRTDEYTLKVADLVQQRERLLALLTNIQDILDALPQMCFVANVAGELILANRTIKEHLKRYHDSQLLGLRPGDIISCEHSAEEGRCGEHKQCQSCGIFGTVALSSCEGCTSVGESSLPTVRDGCWAAQDFKVSVAPLGKGELSRYLLISLLDISSEKRRSTLERTFFHDVLNCAAQVVGGMRLLEREKLTPSQRSLLLETKESADQLVDEIKAQRDLLSAESDELAVVLTKLNTKIVLNQVCNRITSDPRAQGRQVQIKEPCAAVDFKCDAVLLQRVLSNMLLNACEASKADEIIEASCFSRNGSVEFWVKNPAVMAAGVQHQIFQRSFSTKGSGRGLGTYSMRLLSKKYLKGEITFESTPGTGTIFRARYPR